MTIELEMNAEGFKVKHTKTGQEIVLSMSVDLANAQELLQESRAIMNGPVKVTIEPAQLEMDVDPATGEIVSGSQAD